jgi:hypothetical protein
MRTETFSIDQPPRLRISLPSGSTELETQDGPDLVVELEGPNEDEALIELRGNELVVDLGRKRLFSSVRSHRLAIRAPHGAAVDGSLASADLRARGRYGRVKAHLASGDVSFESIEAGADVATASGDVHIQRLAGGGAIRSASGDVELGEVEGDLSVKTASGDVRLESVAEGKLSVHSASGDVEVGITRGSTVWMDVNSMSGDTSCELEPRDEPPAEGRPLVELRAVTMSGDVTIKRA